MNTITKNGEIYIVIEGEKIINGKLVKHNRTMWIGTEKKNPVSNKVNKSDRVLGKMLEEMVFA